MRAVSAFLIIAICFPAFVYSQLNCNRCYGNSYCNNANHDDYATNIRTATCNVNITSFDDLEINDPMLRQLYRAINENSLKDLEGSEAEPLTRIEGHCLTATVHEPHDTHTLRTCVTRTVPAGNNVTLCELLGNIIAPLNWYNGTFTCRQCNETHLCNNHTLDIADGIEPPLPSNSNMIYSSLTIIIVVSVLALSKLI